MAKIIQTLIDKASAAEIDSRSRDSMDWFMDEAKNIRNINVRALLREDPEAITPRLNPRSIGRMYMFFYDPKLKAELPYYDKFPLVFPFRMEKDGFYALNLHYISPMLRAKLLDAFMSVLNNNKYDNTTRVRMSYNLLQSAAKFKYFSPCVKRYLNEHVRSPFLNVHPVKWTATVFLPTERFVKAKKDRVFRESRRMIYGR